MEMVSYERLLQQTSSHCELCARGNSNGCAGSSSKPEIPFWTPGFWVSIHPVAILFDPRSRSSASGSLLMVTQRPAICLKKKQLKNRRFLSDTESCLQRRARRQHPPLMQPAAHHVLSIDVEDYFQVEAFARDVAREDWDRWPSRVVDNTKRCLDLCDEVGAKATYFTLGWVANKFPGLVREIHQRGHELACHSFWHRRVYTLTPEQFREDVRQAKDIIEQTSGAKVEGYRAPSWSITAKSLWALEVLAEEGFTYDSSIFPINHDLYGIPGANRFPYRLQTANGGSLTEFPPVTVKIFGATLPAAGGGHFRLLP